MQQSNQIYEDSLQNFNPSPKKKSVSPTVKEDKQRALFQQLKQKFIIALSKLQSSETRQIGLQQIRQLIDKNRQAEHIRLFLALMKSLKIQGTSSSTKQHEILIFSIMAQIDKQNLIDPIDKPSPSRVKTCFRIIQILHAYFTDVSGTVQQACARVLIDLGKYVLQIQSDNPPFDTQTYMTLLIVPLTSILKSGVDKASQSTSSVCLNEQIQYWKAHTNIPKYREMLDAICSQMLNVSLRLNCEYHQIFMALSTLIEIKGFQFLSQKLAQFVSKILGVINKINNKNVQQNASNFNSYMCKVNVCGILQRIGVLIRDKPQIKAKLDELDVAVALQKATRNRVIQVQMAASRALRAWNGQILSPQKKQILRPSSANKNQGRGIKSLQEARNQKKRLRSNSKQQKLNLERQLNHIQADLNKLVKGGWGAHNRANNFVKKNTGGGGGYTSKMQESRTPSPGAKVNKSHKEHIEQLRKFIKQNSKEYGNKDKFVFYEDKNQSPKRNSRSRSKSPGQPRQLEKRISGNNKQLNRPQNIKNNISNNNNNEDSVQFMLNEDCGDQMVAYSQQQHRNPYADSQFSGQSGKFGRFDTEDKQFIKANKQQLSKLNQSDLKEAIDEDQMKQLLQQQKQITLDIQSKKQLKSKNNLQIQSNNKQSKISINVENSKVKLKDDEIKTDNNVKNVQGSNIPTSIPNSQQNGVSNRRPKVLDDGYNKNIIQQKPLDKKQQMKNQNIPKKQQKMQQKMQQNKIEQSKKPRLQSVDSYEVSLDGVSQKMSDSVAIEDIMNQSDFQGLNWNPFKKNTTQKSQKSEQANGNFAKKNLPVANFDQKQSMYKDSLALSQSLSKSKSPPKQPPLKTSKNSQFTLNPDYQKPQINKNKYNSFQQNNNDDAQLEQILDQSKYEQSMPNGQRITIKQQPPTFNNIPNNTQQKSKIKQKQRQNIQQYYKKSVEHGEYIDKKTKSNLRSNLQQESINQVYQQMIKNPPRSHLSYKHDTPSQLKNEQEQQNKEGQEQESQKQNITQIWTKVLQHIENNQLNQAYSLTFQMDDPIYLLRLMLVTGTPLKKLTPANTCKLWQKFMEIYQHRFIDNIFVQMFTSASKLSSGKGLSRLLSIQQLNQLLIQLYQLSGRTKGKLSFGAATLYNQIEESINKTNQ